MDVTDDFATERKPNTAVVVLLMLIAALTFSYLVAYALPEALAASQVIPASPRDVDARPHWMVMTFVGLSGTMLGGTAIVRVLSARHLRRIDAAGEEGQLSEN